LRRRIDQCGQTLGQRAACLNLGLRNQARQDAVEQVHMGRLETGGALQEQI